MECCLMAAAQPRWYSATVPREFPQELCSAAGSLSQRISVLEPDRLLRGAIVLKGLSSLPSP